MRPMNLTFIEQAVHGKKISGASGVQANIDIEDVSTDSRGDLHHKLFVPLVGEVYDGHNFLESACQNGAAACLSHKQVALPVPVIQVENTSQALLDLAMAYKAQFSAKTVAITGSMGKTTTKDMLASVLAQKYNTLKTEGNFNNEIGLPHTVFRLDESHEYAVLEVGMNHFGELERLSRVAKPDVCLITNIGISHIENLGSQEGILKAKCEIFTHMSPTGTIVLNGDDPLLVGLKATYPQEALFYGLNPGCDVTAHTIENHGLKGIGCTVQYQNRNIPVHIPFPGKHMVSNALAAAAMGFLAGLSDAEIKAGIETAKLTKMRMDIKETPNGITLINDAYNASPQSMMAAIDILKEANSRKVCILGDMLELGEQSPQHHADVGHYAALAGVDVLMFAGERAIESYNAAKTATRKPCIYFKTRQEAEGALAQCLEKGDTVLVKASRGMKFENIVHHIETLEVNS